MTLLDARGQPYPDREERPVPLHRGSIFAGVVVGAVLTVAVVAGVLLSHQPVPESPSYSGRATITKAPIDNNGMVCLAPVRGSELPPGPPCTLAAYTGVLGPDLAALQVGDRVRYTTFETTGETYGTVTGVILYRPTDPEWESNPLATSN